MSVPTPHESFMDSIARFEGGWQAMREDSGNWVNCPGGRKLIGTMRGITPAALAQHIGIDPCILTPETMQETVTLELAAEIGIKGYYTGPGFDRLPWSPLVWIAVDIGWGSGPARGIKMLQELVGAFPDGVIGPQTMAAYHNAIGVRPLGDLCDALSWARRDFYLRISEPGSKNHKFRKGWLRRADYYTTTGNDDPDPWWPKWVAKRELEPELIANATASIQRALNRYAALLGVKRLKVDGILGEKTRAALAMIGI